jgi:tryptophan-rich sensory protein
MRAQAEFEAGATARRSTLAQAIGLVGWLALTFVAAACGAIASIDAPSFYAQLARPPWAPPSGVFGPVWSALYLLMAVAAWLVWREHGRRMRGVALALYVVQLVVNALWSWLFFAWHRGALAFADVVVLLVLIAMTIAAFMRVRVIAGVLLVPYLAWVAFATALTWAVWRANPALL